MPLDEAHHSPARGGGGFLRRFCILGLGAGGGPGRAGADAFFCKPYPAPHYGLAHQLGAVSALGAHVLMLHLINLSMHKAVNATASSPAHPLDGAGMLGRLLVRQLLAGRLQLATPHFHAELGLVQPLLLAFLPEFGLFRLLARLARSVPGGVTRLFAHWPCPPAWLSAGHTIRCPWGNDLQRGWW